MPRKSKFVVPSARAQDVVRGTGLRAGVGAGAALAEEVDVLVKNLAHASADVAMAAGRKTVFPKDVRAAANIVLRGIRR